MGKGGGTRDPNVLRPIYEERLVFVLERTLGARVLIAERVFEDPSDNMLTFNCLIFCVFFSGEKKVVVIV